MEILFGVVKHTKEEANKAIELLKGEILMKELEGRVNI